MENPIEDAMALELAESDLMAEEGRLNDTLDSGAYKTLTGRERCYWMVVADILGEYRRDRDAALLRWMNYQVERDAMGLRVRSPWF